MIEWYRVEDKLPNNNDMCMIYSDKVDRLVGPIMWKTFEGSDKGAWVDIFATPEAGAMFHPGGEDGPTHWAIWNGPENLGGPENAHPA